MSHNTVLLVTHDMAVHANVADRVMIMYAGRIAEEAPTESIFNAPLHPYTQHLIRSLPMIGERSNKASLNRHTAKPCQPSERLPVPPTLPLCDGCLPDRGARFGHGQRTSSRGLPPDQGGLPMSANGKLLDVQHVTVEFHIGGLMGGTLLVAVNDISFSLDNDRPEIFTLAGESGSGKTTLSRLLLRDLEPTRGKVLFEGRDLATIRKRTEFKEFMKKVQPVFQNPFETFSPLRRVEAYLFDTALNFGMASNRRDAAQVVDECSPQVWDCRWMK